MNRVFAFFLVLGVSLSAQAEKINFPEEELATESVLPVFDQPTPVKKRNVIKTNKVEFGAFGGALFNEAFFDMFNYGLNGSYHFDEYHSAELLFGMINARSSQFVPQLNDPAVVGLTPLNLQYLPPPKYYFLGSYVFTPYYGKISLTKQTVINQSLYVTVGGGMMSINGEEMSPAVSAGVGQNYYFTPAWGLKLDFRGLLFQSPNPLTGELDQVTSTASVSRFDKQINFNISITLGLLFLL